MEAIGNWKRSCYATETGESLAGQDVTLMGWAHRRRDLGSLIFVFLRDRSGLVQVVFDQADDQALFERAAAIRNEYVIAVKGQVRLRSERDINPALATGRIEVLARELKILNVAQTPPFGIEAENVSEILRLQHRYLDLRREKMQKALMLKHSVTRATRAFLDDNGFMDIETPVLIKSTPEGARDYVVPSRVHPGKFYALPQSPQIFKQLLMMSGFDRYYQIVKCFRDEDLRADRQPEFQQVDIELSFITQDEIMQVIERYIQQLFSQVAGYEVPLPLPRMTYDQAMDQYGSDKPDTRFDMRIQDIAPAVAGCDFKLFTDAVQGGGAVRGVVAKGCAGTFSRKELDALTEVVKTYKARGMIWFLLEADGNVRSSIAKFLTPELNAAIAAQAGMQPGDALFIVAGETESTLVSLGALRLELARRLNLIPEGKHSLLWVTDFPMFERDEETGRCAAKHHPFTAPRESDIPLLNSDPLKVHAQAYDMVCDGYEIGGGSIRIHDPQVQSAVLDALGFTPERAQNSFGFLLEALRYGAPPHGGIAFGLDRLVMVLGGYDNIRDVVAFPKVQSAACLLSKAPDFIDGEQLDELHIRVAEDEG